MRNDSAAGVAGPTGAAGQAVAAAATAVALAEQRVVFGQAHWVLELGAPDAGRWRRWWR
eukprot:COSAG06_NODE_37_length_30537_cov_73.315658_17_plen_59_part_00